MKPLDFVKTPMGAVAIILEVTEGNGVSKASIAFIGKPTKEKNAWWEKSELTVIDNLPRVLAYNLAHPMGNGKQHASKYFGGY